MATANDVVEEALRHALGGNRGEVNVLDGTITNSQTTLSFEDDAGGLRAGAEIEIDLEIMRVRSVTGSTATVIRGWAGTTAAGHNDGSVIYVSPRFPRFSLLSSLNQEIADLSSPLNGLYRMRTVDLSYSNTTYAYDLGVTDIIDVYEVRHDIIDAADKHWMLMKDWTFTRNQNTTDFATGNALILPTGEAGRAMRVLYKATFASVSTLADDLLTTSGIPVEMQDILSLGMLLRLGPMLEIRRNDIRSQGDSRRAEEVPPQAVANSFRAVAALRQQRIQAEAARLQAKYPYIR